MKKWTTILAVAALSLGLAACDEKAAPVENTEVAKKSDLTLQQVYEKSIAVSEELKSVQAVVDMKQKMHMPDQGMDLDVSSSMDMEYVIEPLQIHQKGTTSMNGIAEDLPAEAMNMESYITKDAFYMYEESTGQWMKFPQEMMGQLMDSMGQTDPSEQLKQIEDYLDDFTFKQDNENYILTLSASGEKFTDLVKAQVDEVLQTIGEGEEIQMDFVINSVNYLIHIDKETFQTNKVDVLMDMDMEVNGEKMSIKQDIKSDFSKFNEVKEIVIPQEVIDNAIEI
ncbi:DUF6612 family protein [Bacillus sp. FJAT-22090]|uniref:DUF6612 family protein n=1 Tax=Bacillus sp. FJAT-22090 TaxID=1581038 RepID=UPI0011A97BCF|nr:DUF6612 family protein [Bacillus sp. FJAT-22090]